MPARRIDIDRIGRGELVVLHLLSGLRSTFSLPIAESNRRLLSQQLRDVEYLLEYVNTKTRRLKHD